MKYLLDNRFNFFSFSFLICLLLYYPTFEGGPVWDDYSYFFEDEVITTLDWSTTKSILHSFSWPTSALSQKILYAIFEKNFLGYRLVNFILHFLNSLLFWKFLKINQVRNLHWAYLIFLLHPSMIISVAWIIQFKTLLSAFFALLCLDCMGIANRISGKIRRFFLSSGIASYFLSLTSKSASLPVALSSWLLFHKKKPTVNTIFIISFIVLVYGLKLITSPVTHKGMENVLSVTAYSSLSEFILAAIPQTLNWYFWQSLIPLESVAIRGGLPKQFAETFMGLFTMTIFFILFRKNTRAMKFFLAAFIMLIPFLGIIPAPYMTSAWVSEQHLYMVLIFFIPAIALIMETIPNRKLSIATQVLSLLFVVFINFQSMDNYKNEFNFYKSSFHYNSNLPAGYQLLRYYMLHNRIEEAKSHFYYMISTIPFEERPMTNMFWAQILEYEPALLVPLE